MDNQSPRLLEFSPEFMRSAGYRVIDSAIARQAGLPGTQPGGWPSLSALFDRIGETAPAEPTPIGELLDMLDEVIWPARVSLDHPRCFAYVPGASNFAGVLGAILAVAMNACSGHSFVAAGPTAIDTVTLRWLAQLLGLPNGTGGVFTSGGAMANLTALTVARDQQLGGDTTDAVAYCSDQTHPTVSRALHVLGFRRQQLAVLPTENDRLPPSLLARRLAADSASGLRPFLVVGNAGTTSTGAVDPLRQIARLCRRYRIWMHVDAACGGAAALTERGRSALRGLADADSVTVDPHKWFFQPYGLGCVLLRNPELLAPSFDLANFALDSDYLAPADHQDLVHHGIELTREFRGLRLWLTLKAFGVTAIRAAVDHGIDLAAHAASLARGHHELRVVAHNLAVVCLRHEPAWCDDNELDAHNMRLAARLRSDGHALAMTATVGGRATIRMCMTNPRTSFDDVELTITRIQELGAALRPNNTAD